MIDRPRSDLRKHVIIEPATLALECLLREWPARGSFEILRWIFELAQPLDRDCLERVDPRVLPQLPLHRRVEARAQCRLASSRCSRAVLSDTAGYDPKLSVFSRTWTRYFTRHRREPDGVMRRYKPPPSNSLMGAAPGLVLRIAVSVRSDIGGIRSLDANGYPKNTPSRDWLSPDVPGRMWKKLCVNSAANVNCWTSMDVFGSVKSQS